MAIPQRDTKEGRGVSDSERRFEFNGGERGNMRFRLANVAEPLGSDSIACDRENRVVLYSAGSYVELKSSGERTPPRWWNGMYVMAVWVGGGQVKPKTAFGMQAWRP